MVNFDLVIQKENTFALEISKSSVRVMELRGTKDKMKTISFAEVEIPKSSLVGGVIRRKEIVAKAIKQAVDKATPEKIKSPYVITVLPDEKIFVKVIEFPFLTKDELRDSIELKIESLIAMPIDEVVWDWHRITISKKDNKVNVLIAAVEKECADSYLETLKMANLVPLDFEISGAAAGRAIVDPEERDKPHLFIDISETTTNLSIWDKGGLFFNTYTQVGLLQLQKAVFDYQKTCDLKDKGKKQISQEFDFTKLGEYPKKEVTKVLDQLVDEIKKVISYYEEKSKHQFEHIYLYGIGSQIQGIREYLEEKVGVEIKFANPKFNIYPIPQFLSHKKLYPHITLMGLALREIKGYKENSDINLLPESTQKAYIKKSIINSLFENLVRITLNNMFVGMVIAVLLLNAQAHSATIVRSKDRLDGILFSKPYIENKKSISELDVELKNYEKMFSMQYNWSKVMKELERITPEGISLTKLNITSKETLATKVKTKSALKDTSKYYLLIEGKTKSRDELITFYKLIVESDYFINSRNPLSNYERDVENQNLYFDKLDSYPFSIEAEIALDKVVPGNFAENQSNKEDNTKDELETTDTDNENKE